MKWITIIICLLFPVGNYAQDTLSLQHFLNGAVENHARLKDLPLLDSIYENTIRNIKTSWLPSMDISGKMTYQSDVIQIEPGIPVPGFDFPSPSKDQYKLSLDLKQNIYDAGMTGKRFQMEELANKISRKEVEKLLYQDLGRVKDLFYSILILQGNADILRLGIVELKENENLISAGISAGTMLSSDLKMLKLERMGLEQQLKNLIIQKESATQILEMATGIAVSGKDSLLLTGFDIPSHSDIDRDELELIDLNILRLDKSAEISSSKRIPVVYAFGQLGYGNPGLNMLKNEFDSWYIVGAGLTWNLWDWNSAKREKANITLESHILRNHKDDFLENVDEALINQKVQISGSLYNISSLKEMLDLREEVSGTYYSLLEYGSIKTIDYLKVVNEERITRMKLKTEEILLQKAIADYKFLEGSLITAKVEQLER